MKPKEIIESSVKSICEKLQLGTVGFVVEHPMQEDHGDYATNVAMQAFGGSKGDYKSPRELAEKIKEGLESDDRVIGLVEKVDIAGPGFINFWLKKDFLIDEVEKAIVEGREYGRGNWGGGKRVLVEYSSPNIAKHFGIGQFRSTIIGDAIRRLYGFSGWETVGDNHLGDWGTQFGMMIAAVEEKKLDISEMSVEEMEKLYVEYNTRVKEDEQLREAARDAFGRLEGGEEKARAIWQMAVDKSMIEYDRIYDLLGVKIDNAYGESAYESMLGEIVDEAVSRGVARESQGALIVEFEQLPPAMLLKSNKTTTYFTRDLATIKFRNSRPELRSNLYIYEVGAEQQLHFQQVFAAAEKLGWGRKEDFVHIYHGMVLGADGKKMSTRKGTTVKVEEWLTDIVAKANEINSESATKVGIGAVKYFDLKHSPATNYQFEIEKALQLEGETGPYLQYAYVRTRAVLDKAQVEAGHKGQIGELNKEELAVLRSLYRFSEVVEVAAKEFAPNLMASYLFELAQRFNAFYNQHKIIGGENQEFRLKLTQAVGQTLSNGLGLLGIETVEKM